MPRALGAWRGAPRRGLSRDLAGVARRALGAAHGATCRRRTGRSRDAAALCRRMGRRPHRRGLALPALRRGPAGALERGLAARRGLGLARRRLLCRSGRVLACDADARPAPASRRGSLRMNAVVFDVALTAYIIAAAAAAGSLFGRRDDLAR